MKRIFVLFALLPFVCRAQLTVEKIMQDPKWIGTSPSNVFWSYNANSIYFKWNPEKNSNDSFYVYSLADKKISKADYNNAKLALDISNGAYNKARTAIAFIHNDDVFLLNISNNVIKQITSTETQETDAAFTNKDSDVVYNSSNNLFAWNIATGITKQLTNFINKEKPSADEALTQQQQWLNNEALQTSSVIKQRKEEQDSAKSFRQSHAEKELKKIYIGDDNIQLKISPDERFIFYTLFKPNPNAKQTVITSYVNQEGYTKEIPAREKVGRPEGDYSFYVYDKLKDTVIKVSADSIAGIKNQPDYVNDYPNKKFDSSIRKVKVDNIYWNEDGSACIVDIFSVDFKDRWIMQLNTQNGKLSLLNHQHDSAWIAGPGIYWLEAPNVGWLNNHSFYFQSEETGYSHLYAYDLNTHHQTAITKGNYEIQKAVLSGDKKYFYLITNEEALDKQNVYRINVDGSNKKQLTTATGGYEIIPSPDEKNIAYRYSYQTKPWELYVQSTNASNNATQITNEAVSDEYKSYSWRDTKIFSFKARDGANVYARIYEPKAGTKNNAAIIFVHGAGYLQNVDYTWSYYFREMMFNNLLADEGFTVMDVDYRGSAGYGRNWRVGIYRYMGGKDLDDEVDAAHYLVTNEGIDSSRIGMYGGSYGGFMTLMAMFTKPGVFKSGAALRSVTDWAHYDHDYTAAILNEPFTDSIAYARSSPINFANGLQGNLLICHGVVDDNVHFQDDVRLNQRLIELGKNNWQLAIYPAESHSFEEPSSWTDEYKRILKLFNETLLNK